MSGTGTVTLSGRYKFCLAGLTNVASKAVQLVRK